MTEALSSHIPTDPLDASRWSRLMARYLALHPSDAAQAPLMDHPEGPSLPRLLTLLAEDPEAMAEDHALLAWEDLDVDDPEAAQPHLDAARALAPGNVEVRILEATLIPDLEARAAALEGLAAELRAGLDASSRAALEAGEGVEDLGCLRLHRCLREWAFTLGELDRPGEVVALVEELYQEAGADVFGCFPLFVHAALQVEDLAALDRWTARMGLDSPALMHWLQSYLHHLQAQPGAAFQALRRARKATVGLEPALFQWAALMDRASEGEPPDLPYPADPASAAVMRILGLDLAGTPSYMGWLRKMRTLS